MFKARASKASQLSFFLSLRQNKRAELLRYSLGAVCKIIGLIVSKLTAVFGNPWQIFLFNSTKNEWNLGGHEKKNDTPMVMLQRQSIKQKKISAILAII